MVICNVSKVEYMYGGNIIFEDLSCEIRRGARIGLIGRNGEGKTTLLKLIAGQIHPHKGHITWKNQLTKGWLEQTPKVEPNKVVQDILYEVFGELLRVQKKMEELEQVLSQPTEPSLLEATLATYGSLQEQFQLKGGYEINAKIRKVAGGLQITSLLKKSWNQLSGGERTKIGLARLLLKSPDLLLLDEPTNHLDLAAINWLTEFIHQYEGTVILVSHDRYFLDETVTQIYELESGELYMYNSNYSDYVNEREARIIREFQQYQDQQKKIRKLQEAIKRLKDWANRSNPPNAGLHRRAKSMEKALMRIEFVKKPVEQKKVELGFGMSQRSGKEVITLQGVRKQHDQKELFRDLCLNVRFQERIGIVGDNGSGKTTLLKMMRGLEKADDGHVKVGSNVSIGYLSQHNDEFDDEKTVIAEFREQVPVSEEEARRILARYLFYGNTVFRKLKQLSGGERTRLRLAELVHQGHNLLLLDEPTNHLDIDAKEALEEALSEFPGTIIAVSHDRYFLDQLFPITYWLENYHLSRYEGNYSFAQEKRANLYHNT